MSGRLILVCLVMALTAILQPTMGQTRDSDCNLPPAPGTCMAFFPRWYYNYYRDQCDSFIYGGCGGNRNNFLTKEECLQTCGKP